MATNDDVAFCGKLISLLLNEIGNNVDAIFYYRDRHYVLSGWIEYDVNGKFKTFHSHWGDDLAEKLIDPLIIKKFQWA
jgi:hypothetical protein